MFKEERKQQIVQLVNQEGPLSTAELAKKLGVSESTIRRDLNELSKEGLIQHAHGGATHLHPRIHDTYPTAANQIEGATIQLIAQLVKNNRVIILEWNPAMLQLPKYLPAGLQTTIITNSPAIALAFIDHSQVEVRVIGGQLRNGALIPTDSQTIKMLEMVHADLYVLGACSVHPQTGISVSSFDDATIKQAIISNASRILVLALNETLDNADNFIVGPINKLTHIAASSTLSEAELIPYKSLGIEILQGKNRR